MEQRIIEIIENLTEFEELAQNKEIDLLENDILDSLSFIQLIEILQDEFNIEIQPTQVPSKSWRTVKNIVELVKDLQESN